MMRTSRSILFRSYRLKPNELQDGIGKSVNITVIAATEKPHFRTVGPMPHPCGISLRRTFH